MEQEQTTSTPKNIVRTPKRLLTLIAYFEKVMADPTAGPRRQDSAAEQLTRILIEVEQGKRERAVQLERARARQQEARTERERLKAAQTGPAVQEQRGYPAAPVRGEPLSEDERQVAMWDDVIHGRVKPRG